MSTEIPAGATRPQDFAKKKRTGALIELPSGPWVKAKPVELTTFIRSGNIPNALIGIVNDALKNGAASLDDLTEQSDLDIETIKEMYTMIDAIAMEVVIDPKVHPVPENEADRSDEKLYIDELEDQDKLYLFNWSSGTVKDLEQFRRESQQGMAAVQEGNGDQPEAESATGPEVG